MADLYEVGNLGAIAALEEAEIRARHHRKMRTNEDPFDQSDFSFVKEYRLTKNIVEHLTDIVSPFMTTPTRTSALSIERKIFTALRFFASGSYQFDIGRSINHAISQPSVSRAVEEVVNALNSPNIFNEHIKFPANLEDLRKTRMKFFEHHQFPGVIGCVDCTHVAIYPPQINNAIYPEAIYINRKGYHSINTQLICDANLKIINVNARFPGSTHDSYIWNNSNVLPYMRVIHEQGHKSFYLLGDSGYDLRPWLLTPVGGAEANTPEYRYNERHRSVRSIIERCNGVLKLRFRCLLKHRTLHYSPDKASRIINACCVLHNLCVDNRIPPVQLGDDEGDEELGDIDFGIFRQHPNEEEQMLRRRVNPELAAGRQLRAQLIMNNFR